MYTSTSMRRRRRKGPPSVGVAIQIESYRAYLKYVNQKAQLLACTLRHSLPGDQVLSWLPCLRRSSSCGEYLVVRSCDSANLNRPFSTFPRPLPSLFMRHCLRQNDTRAQIYYSTSRYLYLKFYLTVFISDVDYKARAKVGLRERDILLLGTVESL